MQESGQLYSKRYKEHNKIGQGNFGTATLVTPVDNPNQYFIAKKTQLSCLKEKDLLNAQKEAQLLKNLKHPHIVQYIESFVENEVLIIIMEYCEEGDLAFHVKRMTKKNESFSEDLILNWFLQIAFA